MACLAVAIGNPAARDYSRLNDSGQSYRVINASTGG